MEQYSKPKNKFYNFKVLKILINFTNGLVVEPINVAISLIFENKSEGSKLVKTYTIIIINNFF